MNGLTVRLWLSIMIFRSLSLHPFQKQWTKHWCKHFNIPVYKNHYLMLLMYAFMLAEFTWEHTDQSDSVGAFKCFIQMFVLATTHTHTHTQSENTAILPEIGLMHATATSKSGQISKQNIKATRLIIPKVNKYLKFSSCQNCLHKE